MRIQSTPTPQNGFTLLELIGVMAVMAILAGALAPGVIEMIDDAYETAEVTSLQTVGDSLSEYVLATKRVPTTTPADWSAAVASVAALSPTKVLENQRGHQRRLYVDRRFFSNTEANFVGYQQDLGLASPPVMPRMLLVSNLDGAVTTNLTTHAAFQAVWDQDAGAALLETDRLLIERVNLLPLFHRVVLNNSSTNQAGYRLESGTEGGVAASTGVVDGSRSLWVLDQSQLSLHGDPFPGAGLQRQLIVTADRALRYELRAGVWQWVN